MTPFQILSYDVEVFLLLMFISLLLFWCYRYFTPYLALPSYVLILDYNEWYTGLRPKRPGDTPLNSYAFQRTTDICKLFMNEGLCVLWGLEPYLFVFGEESVKLLSNEVAATDKPPIYNYMKYAVGNGIFLSKTEVWREQKKLLSPAFYTGMLKDMEPIMNQQAAILVEKLNELNGQIINETHHLMETFALRIFFETALGLKVNNSKDESKLKHLMEMVTLSCHFITYRGYRPWLYFDFALFLFPIGRERQKVKKEMDEMIEEILQNLKETVCSQKGAEEHQETNSVEIHKRKRNIGEILIEEHLRDPSFTMESVKDQLLTLIIAGTDTVAGAMEFCLLMLGLHPDVQSKAYNEVMSFANEDVHHDDLRNMIYLEAVIKESLRLYPSGPIFGRYLKKDLHCGKYKLPKNTTVMVFPYLLHRNPVIYPDPETFDPNRFLNAGNKIKPGTYIPFAEGVRSCIGKNYAMVEMKILLAHILRNFEIVSLDKREDLVLSWEITLKNLNPLRMKFIPR